ncbi:hypothetical protein [Micromonospora sp. KC723]|uniref:hypothetical protein n=1 Tax=Micromonospora sp. KC723 TaxID=2530381 RepID=UPI001050D4CD|nr:hypothetical protein [Micromonospora sp. KC723]TDB78337.1 hypothetical protein E1165_01375 [Micromonospora sp. KC723]
MIEILTSGVALGVHVPGLLLADRLRERGVPAGVSVLERLLPAQKLATTAAMKWAFHREFRFALAGQRIGSNPASASSEQAVLDLLDRWRSDGIRRFVAFSGFWLPLLERYAAGGDDELRVDVCHVDSVSSPSFDKAGPTSLDVRHVWLADAERQALPWTIPVTPRPPVPWPERARRLLVHGGGWGMGTYRERAAALRARTFPLDVVAYEPRDLSADDGVRYFMTDPDWHPWCDDGYPPFGRVRPGAPVDYRRGIGYHGSFDLTRNVVAMVSKPGGGTLLDSLWSATPMVLLEPFGEHERRNAELWQSLGFGISFERWQKSGFDVDTLEGLHHALLRAAPDVPDYPAALAAEVSR